MVRMRTIKECAIYFKEQDPKTGISEHYIRHLVRFRGFPHIKAGNKYLINLDMLEQHLSGHEIKEESE